MTRQFAIVIALLANYCVLVPVCINSPNLFFVILGLVFAFAGAVLAFYFIAFGR